MGEQGVTMTAQILQVMLCLCRYNFDILLLRHADAVDILLALEMLNITVVYKLYSIKYKCGMYMNNYKHLLIMFLFITYI